MTLEDFEKILCTGGLVMWVSDWPLVQGTGVQISLEPHFFSPYFDNIFQMKAIFFFIMIL